MRTIRTKTRRSPLVAADGSMHVYPYFPFPLLLPPQQPKELIKQGDLRMGVMVQHPKGDFKYPQWNKFKYFEDVWIPKNPGKLTSLSQVSPVSSFSSTPQQRTSLFLSHYKRHRYHVMPLVWRPTAAQIGPAAEWQTLIRQS